MVEWKRLGEVCEVLRGKRLTKSQLNDKGGYPVLHGGSTPMGYYEKFNRKANTTVVVNTGNAGSVFYYDKEFWSSDACFSLYPNKEIIDKYLYLYVYGCERILKGKIRAGAMPTIDAKAVEDLIIPIPSLSEQTRIVDILDTFTSSIDNLKEQIAERRKQYEHYRDQLLDLEGKEGVEMKKLEEMCEIKGRIGFRGYTREDQVAKGEGALTLTATNIVNQRIDYTNNTYITWDKYYESPEIMVNEGDIIVCQRGSIGKIAIIKNLKEKATINPQLLLLKKIRCNNRYLIHYLLSQFFQESLNRIIGHGTVQMIAQKDLKELRIPAIESKEQSRIVSILDTFEASIANLEAQLELREKQYDYYRNKLLTFE